MITYVQFQRPVTITSIGQEFWSATEARHKDIACEDKGNHLLFSTTIAGKSRRVRVPLTNIAQVTEEGDAPKKEKP